MNETFQPRSNLVWAGISISLIFLFCVNSILVNSSYIQIAAEIIISLLLAALSILIWVKPKLVFRENSVVVVNPISTTSILYGDVIELETQWALKIIHTKGKTTVWVAPASGKRKWIAEKRFGMYGANVPLTRNSHNVAETMSGSLDSFSGQAAYMIRERIKGLH